jgi:membrane protein DedA with SNARE-associated domain
MVVAAAAVLTSVTVSGVAFAPALLTYSPLLLIAMSPIPRHLVLAAPLTDPIAFVAIATLRRVIACTMYYFLGQTFGESGLEWLSKRYPKARRLVRWIDRLFQRVGALVLVVAPSPPMSALAGNAGLPLWQFVPAVAIGQAIWCSLTYWLGDFLGEWTMPFIAWLRTHVVSTTIACAIAVVLFQLARRYWQRKRAGDAIQNPLEP